MVLIKASFLSKKKLKLISVRFKLLDSSALKSLADPFAIKFSKVPSSVKKISISETSFPSLILLLSKLLKFEGLMIFDNFFN